MNFRVKTRYSITNTHYELQEIEGSDGSVWIRVSADSALLAVFSAERQGPGVMPKDRVVIVLAEAATARDPRIIINALRFLGWDFWPATPQPLRDYLMGEFLQEVKSVDVVHY